VGRTGFQKRPFRQGGARPAADDRPRLRPQPRRRPLNGQLNRHLSALIQCLVLFRQISENIGNSVASPPGCRPLIPPLIRLPPPSPRERGEERRPDALPALLRLSRLAKAEMTVPFSPFTGRRCPKGG